MTSPLSVAAHKYRDETVQFLIGCLLVLGLAIAVEFLYLAVAGGILVIIGSTSNVSVMWVNNGKMPVYCSDEIAKKAVQDNPTYYVVATSETSFFYLGDVIRTSTSIHSVGDICIVIGTGMWHPDP
ncbi:MAG: DUF5317 family protein [bacterium]|nr:DUF5317 family protein [bacterium]